MSYSHRNTNVNYLKTYQTLSSASKNNAKIANTPNYYMTQTSFKSSNKSTYHATNSNYKSKTFIPRLQCTCNKGLQTIQKRELRCTCGINERSLSKNMKSRFDNSYNTINYRKNTKSVASNNRANYFMNNRKNSYTTRSDNSRVCTCRNKKSNIPNLKTTNIETSATKKNIKPDENSYQYLSSHESQISSLFMQNIDLTPKQGSIKILIPIEPNQIDNSYRLELLGTSAQKERDLQEKKESNKKNKDEKDKDKEATNLSNEDKNKISKSDKKEEKEENSEEKELKEEKEEKEDEEEEVIENGDYEKVSTGEKEKGSLKIRANIVKVNDKEDKAESVSSEYDVLQKIVKYEELKYKTLVDQNLEQVEKEQNMNNNENKEEINENIEQENQVNMNEQNQEINAQIHSPKATNEKTDIIIDSVQSPEDSPYPVDLINSKKKLEIKAELINQTQKILENAQEQNVNVENLNEYQNEVIGANNENIQMEGEEQDIKEQQIDQIEENVENVENMENQVDEENIQENNQDNNQEAQNEMVSFEMEENAEQNNVNDNEIENNENMEEQNVNKSGEEEQNIQEEEVEGEEEKNLSVNEKQENEEEKGEEEEDEENIENQLIDYVEEKNKISKEKINKKIKVYNINDNKNIKFDMNAEQDPESLIIVISTSVKSSKNGMSNLSIINENVEKENEEEYGPKNSIRKE